MVFNSTRKVNVLANGDGVKIAPIYEIETERDFVQPMQRLLDRFHGKSAPFTCVSKAANRASFDNKSVKIDFEVDLATFQYSITSDFVSAAGFGAGELYSDMIKIVLHIYGNTLTDF
jgi:hypothetical protein